MSFQNQPASRRALTQAQLAVHAARRHRVSVHRKTVTGIFVGGSLAAGAFTFLPGQLMWRLVFGRGGLAIGATGGLSRTRAAPSTVRQDAR